MARNGKLLSLLFILLVAVVPTIVRAETFKGLSSEGSCAIVGMSAEQCQLLAVQRARAAVIEQAAGVRVSASTLVTDMKLTADFIKTFSRGLIVAEKVAWLPLGQYQKDAATPPIPEYRVRIVADVALPQEKVAPLGLRAATKSAVYRSGEKAVIEVSVNRPAWIAIFNITAADEVVMLFPNSRDRENALNSGELFTFPNKGTTTELVMETLPGHERDAEAFLVAAVDPACGRRFGDLFSQEEPLKFAEFFRRFAMVAECGEDQILAYEVVGKMRGRGQ